MRLRQRLPCAFGIVPLAPKPPFYREKRSADPPAVCSAPPDVAQDPRFRRSVNPPWPGAFFCQRRKRIGAPICARRFIAPSLSPGAAMPPARRWRCGFVGECPPVMATALPRMGGIVLAPTAERSEATGARLMDVSNSFDQALESGQSQTGARRRPWKALSQPTPQSAKHSTAK